MKNYQCLAGFHDSRKKGLTIKRKLSMNIERRHLHLKLAGSGKNAVSCYELFQRNQMLIFFKPLVKCLK